MNEPGLNIRWLDPGSAADNFPPPSSALQEPNGLLAVGGDLSTERLLTAYRQGIFPWYSDDQPILWWSPDPRTVLFPAEFHRSRSLIRTLRRNRFAISFDQSFRSVMLGCADRGPDQGTWITAEMLAAYVRLHAAGYAHSIEIWQAEALVGGLYGINIGHAFFAESMFHRASDASKIALSALVSFSLSRGIGLIDCQMPSAHLSSLGCRQISRDEYLHLLGKLIAFPAPRPWKQRATGCRDLLPR